MKSIENKTLVKRITFTIFAILIFHLLSFITIPGVNGKELAKIANNQTLQIMSMFTGGGFNSFSLMSMGLSGYITAQIVVQLLQSGVVPTLEQWAKAGEVGRHKLDQLTRTLTLILSFVQSIGITAGINMRAGNQFLVKADIWTYIVIGMLMTAGSFLAMWIADQITDKGLGSGTNVIITFGTISRLPSTFQDLITNNTVKGKLDWFPIILALVITFVLTWTVAWINSSEHRTSIQYARREVLTGKQSYLPLKIIVPGMVPIVFAGAIISLPQSILMFFENQKDTTWYQVISQFFTMNSATGMILYGVLIISFTYIYGSVQLQPEKIADNFTKQEAYIPGVVPGRPTAEYFKRLLNDLALPGSIFLVVISIIPMVISTFIMPKVQFGLTGSSLIIIAGCFTEIRNQVQGLRLKANYAGFLNEDYQFD